MSARDTSVLIVGGGAAGITAAIGLARRKIPVVVLEGGLFPGAENWSGAVYFCENLVRPEILGEELLAQTPIERRVVQRGLLLCDGDVAVGASVQSPDAFAQCYTVLRPIFDHDLAEKARLLGAEILSGTQALALIRDGDRIQGVLTDRGPIYADVVFLAEGDASNLVSREGLETLVPGEDGLARPEFLQGIKEVLELPAKEIERRFGVREGEGACFEILLRNPTVRGAVVPLNAGAFLYTNRESLSLGLVAPLANLNEVGVPHNQLMEWLKGMPALRGVLDGANPVSFGTKVIRGGGWKQMPRLCLDGLCVGGAASGIGLDFPCPNYTGPATFMGWAFSEAVAEIHAAGGTMTREALERGYVARVHKSVYLDDVFNLKEWPHFVSSSREFFGRQVDVAVRTADASSREDAGPLGRRVGAARALVSGLRGTLRAMGREARQAADALGLSRGLGQDLLPAMGHWTWNLLRGWFPRRTPTGARLITHLWDDGGTPRGPMPWIWRYNRWRLAPGIAEALHQLYRNDGLPVTEKVRRVRRALVFRLSWLDLIVAPFVLAAVWVVGSVAGRLRRGVQETPVRALDAVTETVAHDTKLAWITYRSDERTHIHFHSAYDGRGLPDNRGSPLFQVCPAKVYKDEPDQAGGVSVAVLHENCIRCETCWRADDRRVDWGRTRGQRVVFETYSAADAWLRESREAAALAESHRVLPVTQGSPLETRMRVDVPAPVRDALQRELERALRHAWSFLAWSEHAPAVLTGADGSLLVALGREVLDGVRALESLLDGAPDGGLLHRGRSLQAWRVLASIHLKSRRFFHFEADLELLFVHHLPDLVERAILKMPRREVAGPLEGARRSAVRALIEQRLDRETVAESEASLAPTPTARKLLFELAATLRKRQDEGVASPGSPSRDAVIEELARVAPGLAVLLSGHLTVLDFLTRGGVTSEPPDALAQIREDMARGRVLAGVLRGSFDAEGDGSLTGTADVALLGGVNLFLVPAGTDCLLLARNDAGVTAEVTGALGLRSAGPGRVVLLRASPRATLRGEPAVPWLRLRAPWDIVAVARGMAGYLAERALDHAASRVQFPGMFKDLRGRDGIAKLGAVQAMLAGITEGLEVLEGLRDRVGSGRVAAGLALDLLAPSPRSIAYLAGQVLGGTAYSEEDPVSRLFRDATALTRHPIRVPDVWAEHGARVLKDFQPGRARLPGLDLSMEDVGVSSETSAVVRPALALVGDAVEDVTRALRDMTRDQRSAITRELGRFALLVLGVRVLAARFETALRRGAFDAVLPAAVQRLAERVAARGRRLAHRARDIDDLRALGRLLLEGDAHEGPSGATGAAYTDLLGDGSSFRSGDLFLGRKKSKGRVYAPELLEADETLAALRARLALTWKSRYQDRTFDGRPYTRHVERLHHVPLEDIRTLIDEGAFRMIIPTAHGGQGMTKAAYYVACVEMMRRGDPTQAIIVMGSASIGTTPILIGLEEDLPEVSRVMEQILSAEALVERIRSLASATAPDADVLDDVRAASEALEAVRKTFRFKAARLVFPGVGESASRLLEASRGNDGSKARSALSTLIQGLDKWEASVRREILILPQREAAHGFFLELIASGAISAFALTEPSAGSDTARIRTRAERCEVPVERDPRGFFVFTPAGAPPGTRRNLFTYGSLEFRDGVVHFIRADRHRVPLQVRDFDHEADARSAAAGKYRYVDLDGERVDVHDIGRVEEVGARSVYPYFSVNGSKMWITNGSIAGVMVLYARTDRGPTGFMLDAHAEGLVVGKDEEKMGQRGSATNELALSDVRIPVDQIIGMEGRGQENALETLNVGRAGLAMCCTGLMHEVIADVRAALEGRDPSPEDLLELGKIALDLVNAESVAYQLVGRFDHPGTESVRLESAVAKALNTEAYHRILTRAERILGAEGLLDLFEMEKRRRDARVLTIYEGTSEIQRYLVLRDLLDVLDLDALVVGAQDGEEAPMVPFRQATDAARGELVRRIREVRDGFGSRGWQEAWLQPVLYRLVEGYMASSAANATLDRLAQALVLVPEETGSRRRDFLTLAASLLTRDLARLDVGGYRQLDAELARVRDGADTASLALADRALLRHEAVVSEGPDAPPCRIEHDALRVAVVLDPHPLVAPTPRLLAGRLREHAVELSEGDRGALREAFALRRGGGVEVTAIGCGRIAAAEVMEEALALGADRAFLINTGTYNLLAQDLSGAVAEVLGVCEDLDGAPFDLILGSRDSAALLVPLARRVDVLPIGGVTGLGVMKGSGDPPLEVLVTTKDTPGPVRLAGRHLLLIDAPVSAASWTFDLPGWREARSRAVSVIDFTPDGCPDVMLSSATAVGGGVPATTRNGPLTVEEAAQLFARTTDLVVGAEGHAAESPQVGVMPVADFFDGLGALAVGLAIEGECVPSLDGAVGAALSVAAARRLPCGVVVFVDTDDRAVLIDAAAHVRSISPDARVSLVPWPEISRLSMVGRGRALESLLEGRDVPAFFVWELREPALLAGEARVLEGRGALLLDGVDGVQVRGDRCVFTGRRFERKLLSSVENDVEGPVQVVLTRDFQPSGGELSGLQRDARIGILDGVVFSSEPEALGALLESAERSLGVSLADADFIIDVGYGVGSRDGIEQVIGPLQAALEGLGVRRVTIGATRKVTQDLGILPDACQIGQTGVTVNPAVMLCIGVSGAPQHLDYIGARAVVFAFNKDPDAPLMTLNRSRLKPVVHPVIGDLFREVPRFVRALVAHVTGATPS